MKKTNIPLGTSYASHQTKMQLKRLFPFLENTYRGITKQELKSKETFKELFGEEEFDAEKLRQLYLYQK